MRYLTLLLFSVAMVAAPGDISAVRVVGSTTSVSDAASACNTAEACNGWVLEVDVDGVPTGGTYSMGLGDKNSVSSATAYCDVTSPGYDATASLSTIVRRVYATKPLRRTYFTWTISSGTLVNIVDTGSVGVATTSVPHNLNSGDFVTVTGSTNFYLNDTFKIVVLSSTAFRFTTEAVTDGTYATSGIVVAQAAPYPSDQTAGTGVTTVRMALSDFVFQGDTLSCTIGPGLYTANSIASSSWSGTPVNSSTITHSMSPVIGNWSWPGWTRINANLAGDGTNNADGSITVRAVAYHRSARSGKPLAAMVFTLSDGTTTVTTTATDMTVDNSISDAMKVVEYSGTFSSSQLATLTQGAALTLNFAAYPWVGDSGAVLNTATTGNTQPTPLASPRTLLLDRTGAYGISVAVVSPTGNDSTCAAVKESAFDQNNPPVACATINRAAWAIRTLNGTAAPTGFGRADAAGVIYLQSGNYAWTGSSNSISGTTNTWTVVKPFPGVSRSQVVINSMSGNAHIGTGTKVKLESITLNVSSSSFTSFSYLWVHDCDLTNTATTGSTFSVTSFFITNSTVRNCRTCLNVFGTAVPALIRGNTVTSGYVNPIAMFTTIGNAVSGNSSMSFAAAATSTGPVVAYNRVLSSSITTSSVITYLSTTGTTLGAAFVQNVIEYLPSSSQSIARIAGDGSTVLTVRNVMLWHNTFIGGTINRASNDTGTTFRLRNLWSEVGNIYSASITKSDTTPTQSAARVGNWSVIYGVGNYGSMNIQESANGAAVGSLGTFQHEFPGISSDWIRISKNNNYQSTNQPPSYGYGIRSTDYAQFVSRRAFSGASAGLGGGDYRLLDTSPAISLIPSGAAVIPFDLTGFARRNNGQGAAGAYEISTVPPTRSATTFYVDKTGSDSNLCTSVAPCLTISRGVSFASQPGDIVQVGDGVYNEKPYISKAGSVSAPIVIRGYSSSCPSVVNSDINSRGLRPAPTVTVNGFLINSNYVKVDCFRLVGVQGVYTEDNSGVIVGINTTGVSVVDSVIDGAYYPVVPPSTLPDRPYSAVYLELSSTGVDQMPANVSVSRNYVFNVGFGFLIYCGGSCLFEDNEVFELKESSASNTDSDYSRIFGEGLTMQGNYFHGNRSSDCYGSPTSPWCHIDCFQTWNLGKPWEVGMNFNIERNTCFNAHQAFLLRDTSSFAFGDYNSHKNWQIRNNIVGIGPIGDEADSQWCALFEHNENITFEHNLCYYTGGVGYYDGTTGTHRFNIHYDSGGFKPYSATDASYNPGLLIDARENLLYRTSGTPYSQTTYPNDILNQQPLFIDLLNRDFRINPSSFYTRNQAPTSTVLKDRLNVNRPQELISDIGPYEYVPTFLQKRIRVIQ